MDESVKPKRYERLGQLLIRPLLLRKEQSAYDLARLYYAQYTELDFDKDMEDYKRNGFVVVRPDLFVLFKPIKYKTENAWFVRCLIGNLVEAILAMPCLLPKLVFCRNNQPDKMVACDTMRLIEVAKLRVESNAPNGAIRGNGTNGR